MKDKEIKKGAGYLEELAGADSYAAGAGRTFDRDAGGPVCGCGG